MGKDHVRLEMVDEQLHIAQPVLGDVLDELVHLLRVLVQGGEGVLKAREEVALLEYARAHKAGHQLLLSGGGPGLAAAFLPALGAAGRQIRRVYRLPPPGDVGAYRQLIAVYGDRAGRVLRKADGRAPPVLRHRATPPVAPQIGVDGVVQAHVERLVLPEHPLRPAVRLQKLKKDLLCCLHGLSPLCIEHAGRICHGACAVIIFQS